MRRFGSCREAVDTLIALRGWLHEAQCQQRDPEQATMYAGFGNSRAWCEARHMAVPQQTRVITYSENRGLGDLAEMERFFERVKSRVSRGRHGHRDWLLWTAYHVNGRHQKTTYWDVELRRVDGELREMPVRVHYSAAELEMLPCAQDVVRAWNALGGERINVNQVVGAATRVCAIVEEELGRIGRLGRDKERVEVEVSDGEVA